jgi:hypothetical protein
MLWKFSLRVRTLLALVAICGAVVWLARGWIYPNRVPGQHFALIGPIDLDHDGRDDRASLSWMILRNGGTVDCDLTLSGTGSGAISSRTNWYVLDDHGMTKQSFSGPQQKVLSSVIRQARLAGIRPMPLRRLLDQLQGQ